MRSSIRSTNDARTALRFDSRMQMLPCAALAGEFFLVRRVTRSADSLLSFLCNTKSERDCQSVRSYFRGSVWRLQSSSTATVIAKRANDALTCSGQWVTKYRSCVTWSMCSDGLGTRCCDQSTHRYDSTGTAGPLSNRYQPSSIVHMQPFCHLPTLRPDRIA